MQFWPDVAAARVLADGVATPGTDAGSSGVGAAFALHHCRLSLSSWLDKDTALLESYLDSGYVYFNSRGAIRDRQYVLDSVGHPTYRVEDMSRTEIIPRIYGTLAIVATRWTATPYYQGVGYDDDQRCVLILSKQSGTLRLLADHCTEIID